MSAASAVSCCWRSDAKITFRRACLPSAGGQIRGFDQAVGHAAHRRNNRDDRAFRCRSPSRSAPRARCTTHRPRTSRRISLPAMAFSCLLGGSGAKQFEVARCENNLAFTMAAPSKTIHYAGKPARRLFSALDVAGNTSEVTRKTGFSWRRSQVPLPAGKFDMRAVCGAGSWLQLISGRRVPRSWRWPAECPAR